MVNLRDLVGFCIDCYYTLWERVKGGKLIFDRSSAKQIFTQKFESLGFQIEHQINWKVDASSRGIQSMIHSAVTLFAPPWLDAFFNIIQSAYSNSVTADDLSEYQKRY